MSSPISYPHLLAITAVMLAVYGSSSKAYADEGEMVGAEAPGAKEAYPAQLVLRPLTLPQGMTQATLSGGYWWTNDEPNIAPVSIRATVGIIDRWDASVSTGFRLRPDAEWREVASLSTRVVAYDSARLDFAPGVYVPVNLDKADEAHLFPGVVVSATTRVYVAKWHSSGFSKVISATCGEGLLPLGVGRRASLNLNCSLVAQGFPTYGIRFSGELFHIRLNGDVRESTFLRTLPSLTYFHSIGNWIDFSATHSRGRGYAGFFASVALRH